MIETQTLGSPGWWLERLLKKLGDRQQRIRVLDEYYCGTAGIPQMAVKDVKDSYRRLMRLARTNFAELVTEAVRERMMPVGFRTGADGDQNGDKEAWRIWQANTLDADSALVHRAALSLGESYVIVGPEDAEITAPLITPEDPREVITEQDPVRKRRTIAALKAFHDDMAGLDVAYVYLPGKVFKATRPRTSTGEFIFSGGMANWSWADSGQNLPAGVMPVVRFVNRADLAGDGVAEFEPHIPVLDRINYTLLNRIEIATLQAFRQRALKGVPDKDETGDAIDYTDVFSADPAALWLLPAAAEIWESQQVDLGPLRQAIKDDVQDLAAVTRTPLFYLTPEANNGSAEGASLAREGLIFKVNDRLVQFGESWERVMRLAFLFAGNTKGNADFEIMWASPERYSLAERYDAASKAQAAGVPWREVMETVLGFSPQQIDRMEAERTNDILLGAALAQQAQPAAGAPGAPGASATPAPVASGPPA